LADAHPPSVYLKPPRFRAWGTEKLTCRRCPKRAPSKVYAISRGGVTDDPSTGEISGQIEGFLEAGAEALDANAALPKVRQGLAGFVENQTVSRSAWKPQNPVQIGHGAAFFDFDHHHA
jgi:hypothetical protein